MGTDKGGHGGVVVNISSLLALSLGSHLPVYAATKTAVLQYSTAMGVRAYLKYIFFYTWNTYNRHASNHMVIFAYIPLQHKRCIDFAWALNVGLAINSVYFKFYSTGVSLKLSRDQILRIENINKYIRY